jgi:hypothetical protein
MRGRISGLSVHERCVYYANIFVFRIPGSPPRTPSPPPTPLPAIQPSPVHQKLKYQYNLPLTSAATSLSPSPSPLPTATPPTPLGPLAQPPYLPYSSIHYSCRPGGPRLFDLLRDDDRCPGGVLEWELTEVEEEIFELNDVRDEDKVMWALWGRWRVRGR